MCKPAETKPGRTQRQKNEHTQKKELGGGGGGGRGYRVKSVTNVHTCKHGNKKCFAKGKRCTKCQKLNHFTRVCRFKPDARKGVKEDGDEELFVGYITSINTVGLSKWYEDLTVKNKAAKFQLVTGAKCSVLPYKVIEDFGIIATLRKPKSS